MFLRKALRHRPWQAGVLVGVTALVVAGAAFGPWFARAAEQSYTHALLTELHDAAAWRLEGDPRRAGIVRDVGDPAYGTPRAAAAALAPEKLADAWPPQLRDKFEPPVLGMSVRVGWRSATDNATAWLGWRDGFCAHLVLLAGRCPAAAAEVVVSDADRHNYGVSVGDTLTVKGSDQPRGVRMRIVGVYRPVDSEGNFWFSTPVDGRSLAAKQIGDYLLTPRRTFETAWWGHTSSAEAAPLPGRAGVDDLDLLRAGGDAVNSEILRRGTRAEFDTRFGDVADRIDAGRRQAATIIPLVTLQISVFALVALVLAVSAMIDHRRPELAIARLRGISAGRIGRDLLAEFGVLLMLGALVGAAIAVGTLTWVRHAWLDGTAPAELPWTVPAAIGAALLAGLLSVRLVIRSVLRQPIAGLLRTVRRVPGGGPGRSVAVVVVALAVAGLLATGGDGRGPLAVLTPALLSLATGLVTARLVVAASAPIGGRALRRGMLVTGLAAVQVARRLGPTRLVPVIVAGAALVGFAGQAAAIAERNRELRSQLEVGAVTVLEVHDAGTAAVRAAADRIDPERRWLTPVVLSTPTGSDGLRTMGVEPDSFRRIAFGGDAITDPAGFDRLRAPAVRPVELRGDRVAVTVDTSGLAAARAGSVRLSATYVDHRGLRLRADLGAVEIGADRPVTTTVPLDCRHGCRVLRLGIRPGTAQPVQGEIELSGLRAQQAAGLGPPTGWSSVPGALVDREQVRPVAPRRSGGLRLAVASAGSELAVQHAWVPVRLPVVLTADTPPGPGLTGPGLDGLALPVRPAGPTTGPVPRNLHQTVVADAATLSRWGGAEAGRLVSNQLWLNEVGEQHRQEIVAGLSRAGIGSRVLDVLDRTERRHGQGASALALRLTPIVGAAAWALVLVVFLLLGATTWRARAYDHASLRMAGLASATLSRSTRAEYVVLVVLAVLAGTAVGVVGGQLALPSIPLFDTPEPLIPVDLGMSWPAVLGGVAVVLPVLLAGAQTMTVALRHRAGFARLREG